MIIGFEFTILLGILGNLIGMLVKGRMPRIKLPDHYDPRFTRDRYGILLQFSENEEATVYELLKEAEAEKIHEI